MENIEVIDNLKTDDEVNFVGEIVLALAERHELVASHVKSWMITDKWIIQD